MSDLITIFVWLVYATGLVAAVGVGVGVGAS